MHGACTVLPTVAKLVPLFTWLANRETGDDSDPTESGAQTLHLGLQACASSPSRAGL